MPIDYEKVSRAIEILEQQDVELAAEVEKLKASEEGKNLVLTIKPELEEALLKLTTTLLQVERDKVVYGQGIMSVDAATGNIERIPPSVAEFTEGSAREVGPTHYRPANAKRPKRGGGI